jgi:hypothetical protein
MRKERKSGVRNTFHGKEKGTSRKKEGQEQLEDKDKWGDKTSILKEDHESRKRERINKNRFFMHHQKGRDDCVCLLPYQFYGLF